MIEISRATLAVELLALSPTDPLLAVSAPGTPNVVLYDLQQQEPIATLLSDGQIVRGLCFSPDGALLATRLYSGRMHRWEVPHKMLLPGWLPSDDVVDWCGADTLFIQPPEQTLQVDCLRFHCPLHPDIWSLFGLERPGPNKTVSLIPDCLMSPSIVPYGIDVRIDAGADQETRLPTAVAISPSRRQIAVGYADGEIELRSWPGSVLIDAWDFDLPPISNLIFAPDALRIAAAAGDRLLVYDID